MIKIRKAEKKDVEGINNLLYQVHDVHAIGRPDIFKKGLKKFDDLELIEIIENEKYLIFVAVDENEKILGHIFCEIQETSENAKSLQKRKVLYVDDLCVDENVRGKNIGKKLYEYILSIAKDKSCNAVTLHIWNFNEKAMKFYEKIGFEPLKTLMEKKI